MGHRSYYRDHATERFDQGWLRTGDIAKIDAYRYITLTDQARDVIKSGGEWISSVGLELLIATHPDVADAAVIGVPDRRWQERSLAVVVPKEGRGDTGRVAGVPQREGRTVVAPERWTFVEAVPQTSVGKRLLRAQYADGALDVLQV